MGNEQGESYMIF